MINFLFNFYLQFRHLAFDQEFKMKRLRTIDSFFKPRSSSGNGNDENTNAINNNDRHIEPTDEQTPNQGTFAPSLAEPEPAGVVTTAFERDWQPRLVPMILSNLMI